MTTVRDLSWKNQPTDPRDDFMSQYRERLEREQRACEEADELIGEAFDLLVEAYAGDAPYYRTAFQRILANWQERTAAERAPRKKARIPHALRKAVFERDGYRCVTCGDWHDLSADHIVAESRGGPTTLENLQTMCQPCNSRKGAR